MNAEHLRRVVVVKPAPGCGAVREGQHDVRLHWHRQGGLGGEARKVLELVALVRPASESRASEGEGVAQLDVAPEVAEGEELDRFVPAALDVAVAEGGEVEVDLVLEIAEVGRERDLER